MCVLQGFDGEGLEIRKNTQGRMTLNKCLPQQFCSCHNSCRVKLFCKFCIVINIVLYSKCNVVLLCHLRLYS